MFLSFDTLLSVVQQMLLSELRGTFLQRYSAPCMHSFGPEIR